MSKAKFHVLRKDRDALPKEVKGIYSGDEFPEYKNANTLTIGGKTYIEGLGDDNSCIIIRTRKISISVYFNLTSV